MITERTNAFFLVVAATIGLAACGGGKFWLCWMTATSVPSLRRHRQVWKKQNSDLTRLSKHWKPLPQSESWRR